MTDTLWIIAALSAVALLVGLVLLWRGYAGRPPTMDDSERAFYRDMHRLARHNQQVERDLRRKVK